MVRGGNKIHLPQRSFGGHEVRNLGFLKCSHSNYSGLVGLQDAKTPFKLSSFCVLPSVYFTFVSSPCILHSTSAILEGYLYDTDVTVTWSICVYALQINSWIRKGGLLKFQKVKPFKIRRKSSFLK